MVGTGTSDLASDAEESPTVADALEVGENDLGVGIPREELEEVGFVEVGGVAE